MVKEYKIIEESGLHARPANLLVQAAASFPNDIAIEYNDQRLTLKSIMAVMSLGVPQQSVIKISVDGDNQEVVFAALEKVLLDNGII